jgi:pimeloyl-ACP methyl ester carboxylesterase
MRLSRTLLSAALAVGIAGSASAREQKPTIVLVHGAFAESSSWNKVITRLERHGYPVVAAPNPLRGVHEDAGSVSAILRSIRGPVVLVGHSYGGPVISEAATGNANVRALVFVSAFIPEVGESAAELSAKYPGSSLASALAPITGGDGSVELYIEPSKYHAQFAADLPAPAAALMAATQRPVTKAALEEPARAASWKALPSYVIYGSEDRNIPPAVVTFMAERANARRTVLVAGGSHALMASHPNEVSEMIEAASRGD